MRIGELDVKLFSERLCCDFAYYELFFRGHSYLGVNISYGLSE